MPLLGSSSAGAPQRLFEPADLRRPFLVLWAIFVLFYFSELAGFSLSIDEESALFRTDPAAWMEQGRWLAYLIERFVLPPPVLPFFPLFVFGGLASLGYIAIARSHGRDLADWRVLLLFVLFGAFPTQFFLLDFSFVTPSFGLALLLVCVGVALFGRAMDAMADGRRRDLGGLFALQALLGAAAIGVYESLILLMAAGCCGVFLLRALRGPPPLRRILLLHAWLLGVLLASVALSALVSHGLQWLLDTRATYSDRFVRLDRLADAPGRVIRNTLREYWLVYGGRRAIYGYHYVTFPAVLALGAIALAAEAWRRSRGAAALVLLYLAGMTLIPFAIHPIAKGWLPYRTLVSVAYVVWFCAAAAALSPVAWIRRLGIALVIVVALQSLHTFATFQAQKRLVLDHDRRLASAIYQRIVAAVPDFDRRRTYPVEFYGAHEFDSPYKEVFRSTWSVSFFEWDRGNPERIVQFMSIIGYANLATVDMARRKSLLPALREMPIWPAAGSVRVVDGIVLVRLGRQPGYIHMRAKNLPAP